jgi:hypothetical protein
MPKTVIIKSVCTVLSVSLRVFMRSTVIDKKLLGLGMYYT